MTNDDLEQRVQGIIKKLDTLELSQEYGQLLKDLYGKVQAMENEIYRNPGGGWGFGRSSIVKRLRFLEDEVVDDSDSADHTLAQRMRYLEAEITKLKSVPPRPAKEFKPGRLGVVLSHPQLNHSSLNGLEITVINGEQKYYGTTKRSYGKAFYVDAKDDYGESTTSPCNAYCEFTELPGGTYSVEVNQQGRRYGLNVTVDGDTFAELKLDTSNMKKNKAEELSAAPAEKPVVSYHSNLLPKLVLSDKKDLFTVLLMTAIVGTAMGLGALVMKYCPQNTITGTIYLTPEQNNP